LSVEELRAKAGKTMVALCVMAGHSKFLQKRGKRASEARGKKIAAQVLPDLQGKGLCGKEAFLLT
jgi:hypothetical protein